MDSRELAERVKAMRDAQREYVRTCTNISGVLLLEQEVDALLADVLKVPRVPTSLFESQQEKRRAALTGGR